MSLLIFKILCHTSDSNIVMFCFARPPWYLENSPLSSLQYSLDPRSEEAPGSAVSSGSLGPSLSTRSNPDHLKRISYSEVALHKAQSGPLLSQDDVLFPGFNPGAQVHPHPRIISRSHHNLHQMPESPEHRAPESSSGQSLSGLSQIQSNPMSSHFQQHHRASSDTDSIRNSVSHQPDKWVIF